MFKTIAKETEAITGEELRNTLSESPYSWNDWTILAIIAATIKHNTWEVILETDVKNPNDNEIVDAFTNKAKNFEKFRKLQFRIAEEIDINKLNLAKTLLTTQFNQTVESPSHSYIDAGIKNALGELNTLIQDTKAFLKSFALEASFQDAVSVLEKNIQKVLEKSIQIDRIREFLRVFKDYNSGGI